MSLGSGANIKMAKKEKLSKKRVARSDFTKNFGHNWSKEADEFIYQEGVRIVEASPFLKATDLRRTIKKIIKAYNPWLKKEGTLPLRYITGRINWYYYKHNIKVTNKASMIDDRMIERTNNKKSDGEKFSSRARMHSGGKKNG